MNKWFLAFFLFYVFCEHGNAQLVKKTIDVPLKNTPVLEFINQEQEHYLQVFPFLLLELKDDITPEELEQQLNIVLYKDFSPCLSMKNEMDAFCRLYLTLFLMGTDSSDLEQFFSSKPPLSDIAYLGRTFYFAINANFDEAKKTSKLVKDKAIINYFRQLFELFSEEFKNANVNKIGLLETQAKFFLYYKSNPEITNLLLQKKDLPKSLYFILGEKYFLDGDFLKAGHNFFMASDYERFSQIALKNAFYSYLNADSIENAKKVLTKLKEDGRRILESMFELKYDMLQKIDEKMLADEVFANFLLEHVKNDLRKGKKISYLSKIDSMIENEELSFITAISKLIYEKQSDYTNFVDRIAWKNKHYIDALSDIKKRVFKEDSSLEKLIQVYSLFNYYPFNFFYANIIKNKNDKLAEQLYETVIRYHSKVPKENLFLSYINLSSIYKKRGKYYTAIKVLDEALKLEQKREDILMEIVRLYALKEDYDELKWRTEKLYKETENPEYKKELQIFIDLCYEKLNITKENESK